MYEFMKCLNEMVDHYHHSQRTKYTPLISLKVTTKISYGHSHEKFHI